MLPRAPLPWGLFGQPASMGFRSGIGETAVRSASRHASESTPQKVSPGVQQAGRLSLLDTGFSGRRFGHAQSISSRLPNSGKTSSAFSAWLLVSQDSIYLLDKYIPESPTFSYAPLTRKPLHPKVKSLDRGAACGKGMMRERL